MKCKILRLTILIIGILLILNAAIMGFVANFNSGIIFAAIFALVLILFSVFFEKIRKIKWMYFSFYAVFGLVVCLIIFIAAYGHIDNVTFDEDAVIVLGAGIRGEYVTLPLAYRLDKAYEYSRKNPEAIIVVSGGKGLQESITEALAMERYLVNKGVDKNKIIKEENSTSTYTNFVFSKEILDEYFNGPYKTVVITNDFHIYRAVRVAKVVGLETAHYHAKIQWYLIPVSYLRECVAVIKVWIMGK